MTNRKQRRAARRKGRAGGGAGSGSTADVCRVILNEALEHHRARRLADAERLYKQILRIDADQPDALHFLGVLADQTGNRETAIQLINRAIALKPEYPEAYNNLGNALQHLGRDEEAAVAYGQAIKLKPDYAEAFNNLGNIFREQGLLEESVAAFEKAAELKPRYATALNNLGITLKQAGRYDDAVDAYSHAIEIEPRYVEAYCNLGNALRRLEMFDDAHDAFEKAVTLSPTTAEIHLNLGNLFMSQMRYEDAVLACEKAIELSPDFAQAHNNLGNALRAMDRLDEATHAYRRALEIQRDYVHAHNNLGNVLRDQGRFEEAFAHFRKVLELYPAFTNVHSGLLFSMNYEPKYTPQAILTEARSWNALHGNPDKAHAGPHANTRDPSRRLRIGYVSPDFREHSVSYFFEPLLEAHRSDSVEVFCYAEVAAPDAVTERIRAHADHWRTTVEKDAAIIAKEIEADGIDLLVDLAGHTGNNRLDVFALRPAPVQVTWLGSPITTGMDAIGYRLTDAVADPPGESDHVHSEELLRLPNGFLCYGPPEDAPDVTALPGHWHGHITFGSFNNTAKVTPEVVAIWARVMNAVPDSRMLLKSRPLGDRSTRERYLSMFAERGIDESRLELIPRTKTTREHLELYARIDIALDCFPYGGTTTTCEALWMGVPVVTMTADRHASRVGASILTRLGLEAFIVASADDYVKVAAALALDAAGLEELRSGLRVRMQNSPLMDRDGFARDVEAAYREIWARWCRAA